MRSGTRTSVARDRERRRRRRRHSRPRRLRHDYEDWIDTLADLRAEIEEILFEADDRVAVAVRNSRPRAAAAPPQRGRYYVAASSELAG